ncbi:hypothetical protein [Actinotalea sp. K2]|uniref:hypothetical protein n=1 Tax=Actinotalea sp. K2 TaxID=2939438 RepID=UPI002016EEF3|nr:hypothetical protein [Actinotalea sp. K2]MCL3861324.1 hypothetical protein [Actinotalea sp. K2]
MATTDTHTCVFYDHGEAELACVCGQLAMYVVEEDGTDAVLVVLEDGTTLELPAEAQVEELAISA